MMYRVLFGLASAASALAGGAKRDPSASKIQGEYIVVFERNTELSAMDDHVFTLKQAGAVVIETYDISDKFRGYAYKSNSTAADDIARADAAAVKLAAREDVIYVEQDQYMYATAPAPVKATTCGLQKRATWGLARVSALETHTKNYVYPGSAGKGITVYVIDSGVRADHNDFKGRIGEIFDGYGDSPIPGDDSNGHGTHVAGTIAGTKWGIAKEATIATVKVLGASGSGSNSVVIAGVQWACTERAGKPVKKRVANMSLGGGYSRALNEAVHACIDKGMPFVVAAGNDYDNACYYSPASENEAITVMASTVNDEFASFSNFGACANIIAPGKDITSAWIGGSTSNTKTISGTSMASPHVCGVAALMRGIHPEFSPNQILEKMLDISEDARITKIPDAHETRNKLLFSDCISD